MNLTNVFLNEKKVLIYYQNEGNSLDKLKINKNIQDHESDIVKSMFNLLKFGQENNFIFNDLRPQNIAFRFLLDNTFYSNILSKSSNQSKTFKKSMREENTFKSEKSEIPFRIRVFQEANTISKIFMHRNILDNSTKSSFSHIDNENNFKIHLKMLNFYKSERENFSIFVYNIEQALRSFKTYLVNNKNKLNSELVKTKVDFSKSLNELIYDDFSKNEDCIVSSTRTIDFSFDYEDDIDKYKSTINQSSDFISTNSTVNDFNFQKKEIKKIELVNERKNSIVNKVKKIFRSISRSEKIYLNKTQIKKDTLNTLNALNKIKFEKINKFCSILDFLKIKSKFIGDCESCFYSILYIFEKYPSIVPYVKKSSLYQIKRKSILNDSKRESTEILFQDEKIKSIFTNDQIDLLIYILAIIEKNKFPEHEVGIMMIFEYYKTKELNIREVYSSDNITDGSNEVLDVYNEDSDMSRFKRLKFLIYDIIKYKKKKVFQLFGLDYLTTKHLLIKLGFEHTPSFKTLSPYVLEFYSMIKDFMFQYLVYVMFSNEYSYLHKFMIIAILKSKD